MLFLEKDYATEKKIALFTSWLHCVVNSSILDQMIH